MYTCAAAKPESQRTADTKTPGEGGAAVAGRTKLLLYGWAGPIWPKKCNRRNHVHRNRLQILY
jgi:hypothetical protein